MTTDPIAAALTTSAQPPDWLLSFINAIGEISKQECWDAIEREWPLWAAREHARLLATLAARPDAPAPTLDSLIDDFRVAAAKLADFTALPPNLPESAVVQRAVELAKRASNDPSDAPAPTCQTCRYWGNEPVKTEPVYDEDGRLKGQRLVESQPWWVARCDRGVSTKHSEGVPADFGCNQHAPRPVDPASAPRGA